LRARWQSPAEAQTVNQGRRQEVAMRHLQSQFHFRHALFALQGPDGYVEALMESAREAALSARRSRPRPATDAGSRAAPPASRR
jgi:hypothetical protein